MSTPDSDKKSSTSIRSKLTSSAKVPSAWKMAVKKVASSMKHSVVSKPDIGNGTQAASSSSKSPPVKLCTGTQLTSSIKSSGHSKRSAPPVKDSSLRQSAEDGKTKAGKSDADIKSKSPGSSCTVDSHTGDETSGRPIFGKKQVALASEVCSSVKRDIVSNSSNQSSQVITERSSSSEQVTVPSQRNIPTDEHRRDQVVVVPRTLTLAPRPLFVRPCMPCDCCKCNIPEIFLEEVPNKCFCICVCSSRHKW